LGIGEEKRPDPDRDERREKRDLIGGDAALRKSSDQRPQQVLEGRFQFIDRHKGLNPLLSIQQMQVRRYEINCKQAGSSV
jgi:hypothetical protein